ncbi:MAG: response regulator [Lachnospiraceae bacterium]
MARVLIVDDSKTSRKMVRKAIEEAGHIVIAEAEDGEQGYLRYKETNPDVVTMDITMPVMDGIEALQLMKKADENVKIIMITALGQKDKMIQAIKLGADEFITKPFDPQDLVSAINKVTK